VKIAETGGLEPTRLKLEANGSRVPVNQSAPAMCKTMAATSLLVTQPGHRQNLTGGAVRTAGSLCRGGAASGGMMLTAMAKEQARCAWLEESIEVATTKSG
jgi:hypothetical protein